jgi:RNA recognition motif-containing protein
MHSTTVLLLRNHLEMYISEDKIGTIRILRDKKTKKSKGFGFVEVLDQGTVKMLVDSSTQHVSQLLSQTKRTGEGSVFLLNGRKLDFQLAKKESSNNSEGDSKRSIELRRLFVGGLNASTDDAGLYEHFSQFGSVSSAYVIRHYKTGLSKRFGYVVYEEKESVNSALYTNFNSKTTPPPASHLYQQYETPHTQVDQSGLEKRKHFLDGSEISIELYKPKDKQSRLKSTQSEIDSHY